MQNLQYSMIILAGGKSTRMGEDKAQLLFQGKTFLELQIEKGRKLGITDILVSGYRGENCDEKIVFDRFCEKGPLGGLESCLREAKNQRALVLSVDVPVIPVTELEKLLQFDAQYQNGVTILKNEEKEQPLIGVYDCRLADAIQNELVKGKGSVFGFLNKIGYRVYESSANDEFFINVNDKENYEKIQRN